MTQNYTKKKQVNEAIEKVKKIGEYKKVKHTIVIQWPNEDECLVVFLPEFKDVVMQPVTHVDTYEEALKNAQEVLKVLSETVVLYKW